ncbi:glycosyltransferase [Phragmitibacter flavus]|uniref:Glycosyltransferase n=1 Tax=Phragmitibacter flavus TaxID=2576071 RepID=A0A5R8KDB8_9BACT|nr:glycosyltransferase [Phragmitibacter flavus]TLD70283.1 glycosyltransferase [Phragmitibacter flavus]
MSPIVSVVLSSYNHVAFVADAVASVLSQDFADFELVIRDDGSTDGTAELLKTFDDPRTVMIEGGFNVGGAASLNRCIRQARGEFVAVINSDDVWLPHRLSTQLEIMQARPSLGAVFSLAEVIDEAGGDSVDEGHPYRSIFREENRSRQDWLRFFFDFGNCLCHPSVLIRRHVYEELGFYDPLMVQLPDFDMWIRLCSRHDLHIHQEPLLQFRVLNNQANASGDSALKRERLAYETTKVLSHYAKAPVLDDLHEVLPEWIAPDAGVEDRLKGLAAAALAKESSAHHCFALDCHRAVEAIRPQAECDGSLLKSGLRARAFSHVFAPWTICRVEWRKAGEKFNKRASKECRLDPGLMGQDSIELPEGTVQVRLSFAEAVSILELGELSLIDTSGRVGWSLVPSSQQEIKVSGASWLEADHSGGSDIDTDGKWMLAGEAGGSVRIQLPEIEPGQHWRLVFKLAVRQDLRQLVETNKQLAKRVKALEEAKAASSTETSWLKRWI